MAMQCGIGSRRSMGGIAKRVSALKILGGLKYFGHNGGLVGGVSQNTPAKETPIKGTFVKNEGWWGVGLGRSWGPLRMGGGGEVASRHPFCRGVPAGADISSLHRFLFCPTFLATLPKKETFKNLATLSCIGQCTLLIIFFSY